VCVETVAGDNLGGALFPGRSRRLRLAVHAILAAPRSRRTITGGSRQRVNCAKFFGWRQSARSARTGSCGMSGVTGS
jgi:hypothetical protein